MHCWGGHFILKKSISDLLLQIAADKNYIQRFSSPSVKAPHELHFWLILLVIINCEHHILDLTNVNNTPHTISFLIGSGEAAMKWGGRGGEGKDGESTEKERERLSQRVKKA